MERTTHAPRNGSSRQRIFLSCIAVAIALVVVTASIIATVPEATAVTIYASDSFGRTASNGWGTADAGGAWTIAGTPAHWSVSPGSGNIAASAGGTERAYLPGVTVQDVELSAKVVLPMVRVVGLPAWVPCAATCVF